MSKVQNYIAQTVVQELSDKLHSKVTVGDVEYRLFNVISIENLYVEDLHRDTLLYTKQAKVNFNFWKIFQSKILVTSIEFDKFYGNLVVDKTGQTNIDFIIQAFRKPKTNDSTMVSLFLSTKVPRANN